MELFKASCPSAADYSTPWKQAESKASQCNAADCVVACSSTNIAVVSEGSVYCMSHSQGAGLTQDFGWTFVPWADRFHQNQHNGISLPSFVSAIDRLVPVSAKTALSSYYLSQENEEWQDDRVVSRRLKSVMDTATQSLLQDKEADFQQDMMWSIHEMALANACLAPRFACLCPSNRPNMVVASSQAAAWLPLDDPAKSVVLPCRGVRAVQQLTQRDGQGSVVAMNGSGAIRVISVSKGVATCTRQWFATYAVQMSCMIAGDSMGVWCFGQGGRYVNCGQVYQPFQATSSSDIEQTETLYTSAPRKLPVADGKNLSGATITHACAMSPLSTSSGSNGMSLKHTAVVMAKTSSEALKALVVELQPHSQTVIIKYQCSVPCQIHHLISSQMSPSVAATCGENGIFLVSASTSSTAPFCAFQLDSPGDACVPLPEGKLLVGSGSSWTVESLSPADINGELNFKQGELEAAHDWAAGINRLQGLVSKDVAKSCLSTEEDYKRACHLLIMPAIARLSSSISLLQELQSRPSTNSGVEATDFLKEDIQIANEQIHEQLSQLKDLHQLLQLVDEYDADLQYVRNALRNVLTSVDPFKADGLIKLEWEIDDLEQHVTKLEQQQDLRSSNAQRKQANPGVGISLSNNLEKHSQLDTIAEMRATIDAINEHFE